MSEPTYLIWTPRMVTAARPPRVVRFNITPLSAVNWPTGGEPFYAQLLRDVGIPTKVESWEVRPYRSRYHGDSGADDWRDRWKRNWEITVHCATVPSAPPAFEEGYETDAFEAKPPVPDGDPMRAMILADFPDITSAKQALTAVRRLSIGFERFELVEVEGLFWQLQIDLGQRPAAFFQSTATEADRIDSVCRELGGWPTFEERIRVLG